MKYAILGGTFNPIHTAHLIMAESVFRSGSYDKIIIMPSGDPPHKKEEVIDKEHRLNMCELATRDKPYFEVSSFEIDRQGRTYTYDTIMSLNEALEDEYSLIIGSDSLMNLESWYRAKDLFKICHFVVLDRITETESTIVDRIDYLTKTFGATISRVKMPHIEISSTDIRDRVIKHQSISYLVEKSVASYIEEQKLYHLEDTLDDELKDDIYKDLKDTLSHKRFKHTKSVQRVARGLASHYNIDINKASLAAMLHDCAKHYSEKKLIDLSEKYHIRLSKDQINNPKTIHAALGSKIANDLYEVVDEDVLNAISYHTTGRPDMSTLEKIIYIADYIEPMRKQRKSIDRYRALSLQSLDDTVYLILKDTIEHLEQEGDDYAQLTKSAYEYYKEIYNNKQSS